MLFVPEPPLSSLFLPSKSSTHTEERPLGRCWSLPRGVIYDHPTRHARFIANAKARADLNWWRSVLATDGLPEVTSLVANDFWNYEMAAMLSPLVGHSVPDEGEIEVWWRRLSSSRRQLVEFHPLNFWHLNRHPELTYWGGLTECYWCPQTPWAEIWRDFQRRASWGLSAQSYFLDEFPDLPAVRYSWEPICETFRAYLTRNVILREHCWPRSWEKCRNEVTSQRVV